MKAIAWAALVGIVGCTTASGRVLKEGPPPIPPEELQRRELHAACGDGVPQSFPGLIQCGDYFLRRKGDAKTAAELWKAAAPMSATREEQCEVVMRLESQSLDPAGDLQVFPIEVVQRCLNAAVQAKEARLVDSQMRAQQRNAELGCENSCQDRHAICMAGPQAAQMFGPANCSLGLSVCISNCRSNYQPR